MPTGNQLMRRIGIALKRKNMPTVLTPEECFSVGKRIDVRPRTNSSKRAVKGRGGRP
jgi:hypothetical protein